MTTLVLHHSAGNQNRPAYDDWVSGKKWYNFIIDGAGKLHTFKETPNQRSCGQTFDLAFSGDFTKIDPTPAQVKTWERFKKAYSKFDVITTHGQLAKDHPGCATATACPGKLLDYIDISWDNDDMYKEKAEQLASQLAKEKQSHEETLDKFQTCETEREDMIGRDKYDEMERKLNTEIGRVTTERDNYRRGLSQSMTTIEKIKFIVGL